MPALRDEDVRGLDVAMDDAFRVRGVKRVGEFGPKVEHDVGRATRADAIAQRLAFEILHDDEKLSIVLADFMNVQMFG